MNLNFPHREAIVVRDHELRVTRRFPIDSDIKVRAGARLKAADVLGRSDPRLSAIRLAIAARLDCPPQEIGRHLTKAVGAHLDAGEPVARMRRGVRSTVVVAPCAGNVVDVDLDSGVVLFSPSAAGELSALVPGDVEYIESRRAVVIRTVGSRVLGIVGIGEAVSGTVRLAVERADQELTAERVTPGLTGAIVVGGAFAGAAALKRLAEVGSAALIVGGFVEKDLKEFLDWTGEDRLEHWRQLPGDRPIADGVPLPFSMMATEGFGTLPIHPAAFNLMREVAGRHGVLMPATRAGHSLTRPELIIPDADALDQDGMISVAALVHGAHVRLVDQAGLGVMGRIVGEARRERGPDGCWADLFDVEVAGGGIRTLHVANIEVTEAAPLLL
ncbi:MAG: hypothetical protein M3R06_05425 [Chloroflexota bacterium]|nr:hypothetical protein [Chloroflexota bacterium]